MGSWVPTLLLISVRKTPNLQKANAGLGEQVEHLEVIVKELYAEIEIKDEAICLYSEAIKHSEERDRLLGRIKR